MAVYSAYSDQELTALLIQGDRGAYTQIYHRYIKLLYSFAIKRLADETEVEDILHELFLSLWNRRAELSEDLQLAPYLYNAIRYQLVNVFAKRKLASRYLDSFNEFLREEFSSEQTDHLIRHKELSALIEKEISALPKKMQEVFRLSRRTGYTRKEIALELGLSEETVKSHMHHALKLLKQKLGAMSVLLFL
ncbi:MAG: RNA polymerase sigma-70 factor [Pedobacter sp.]|nr:MAG: RNA polymerase sigma-70 factor [Pedobacter sp.]